MKDGSYVVIQSFMVTELGLKGNELIVYATIYGFTQDGSHWFYGTRGYLAEWCGATRDTVDRCLKSLIAKGYVERRDIEERGRTIVEYRATKNTTVAAKSDTLPEKLGTPTRKTRHIDNLTEPKEKKDNKCPTIEEVEAYVADKGYHFDARHFWEYYDSSGWKMQSGKPVKNWRQCCVTWERNWKKSNGHERRPANDGYVFDPSQYNYF